jgi:hypothetical protein
MQYGYPQGVQITPAHTVPLDPCEQQQLQVLEEQDRVTSWPYYSTVKFIAPADSDPNAGAPAVYNYGQGVEVTAYSYAVGDGKEAGGFVAGDGNATIADTNLTTRRQTTGGQNVLIHGIAMQWNAASLHFTTFGGGQLVVRPNDYQFLGALHESVSVELGLNGDENTFRLGTIGMIPGAGGLTGGAPGQIDDQRLAGNQHSPTYPNNGWAVRSNYLPVPEGLIWRNQSNADSQLQLRFRNTRPIRIFAGGMPENNILGTAFDNDPANVATGEGQLFPTELVAELKVFLIAEVIGPRSRAA